LYLIRSLLICSQELHGNTCKYTCMAFSLSLMCHVGVLSRLRMDFSNMGLHMPLYHVTYLNDGFSSSCTESLSLLLWCLSKKAAFLRKACLVLPCPRLSVRSPKLYILKDCAKTTGLLLYLGGCFIVADPKPVSRSQNEWDFKSCSHPLVL